ncbi:16S rRNA (cytosine(1402)-N(4))-methyltransferase RsmH [Anaerofustis stercorihominis]|uniref:16S rRNA (cytosine(1402)-N(4))-methyltransferase RsmH n=1 Tax=Anaerofustis stercorihominis TaxID=214853 RepID=UPI00210965B8|nr:16S rRNA (cytosine(1402)-N(4))-methyltransferase RsmH [Anaerofustis stercorihominis]MCQ4794597.1 16S rRNA (cytosine(1402)-N(4))-methyltransferase RsmH [Anaerofustis stercorihominis]
MKHISVLYQETIDMLNIKEDGIYVDGTMGGAGHSLGICKKLSEEGIFIGIDQDDFVFDRAKVRLESTDCKKEFVKGNFHDIKEILMDLGIDKIDGMMADLGVSSFQIDDETRGFSFKKDGPLDMRMDKSKSFSAKELVNTYSYEDLRRVISEYGEEQFAGNIAKHILKNREEKPIETTYELVEIIKNAIPKKFHQMKHPAKKTFQAIRIEVNDEIDALKQSVEDMIDVLDKGGRFAVITFHSLEDRIVKKVFSEYAKGCTCPKEFPVCVCGNTPKVKVLTRKPLLPTEEEIEANPRSRSAKLRVIEKL